MDVLSRAYAQWVDLLRSMTAGARLTSAVLLIVVLASLAYLLHDQVARPDAYLMGGQMFSPSELRDMQAAFGKAGLEPQIDGARVKVPQGQESKYMAALAEAGAMPGEFGDYLKKAVSGNSYLLFRPQAEAMIKVARQSELQSIINHLPGVEKSAVQIDEHVERGLNPKKIVTASVSIVPKANQHLDDARVAAIRCLVASSVAELKPEAVSVVDLGNARPFPGTGGADAKMGGAIGDYADTKRRLESDWQEKISGALSYIPGVVVRTNVELDAEVSNEETSIEYGAHSMLRPRSEATPTHLLESETTLGPANLNAPAAAPTAEPPLSLGAILRLDRAEPQRDQPRKALPTTQKRVVREGRTPKHVTVSVAVPFTYYEQVWRHRNAVAKVESEAVSLAEIQATEKKKIEETALALLPSPTEARPQVAVATFYPTPPAAVVEPTLGESVLAWLAQNWSAVGLAAFALASLLLLRSMIRSGVPTGAAEGIAERISLLADESPEIPPERALHARHNTRGPHAATLRDELAERVSEDPLAAIGVLRTWVGNAS